ncbi:MAG: hypothetical protein KUG72_02120 [Pseudomonadales bacterium]|nr:hypothetical protein [Pseudomonadales bacterium]
MRIITIILTLLLTSCFISAKQYVGPEQSADKLAILYNSDLGNPVQINEINGNFRGVGYVEKFTFLPGKVSILAAYNPADKPTPGKLDLECDVSFVPLTFNAKADTKYLIDYQIDKVDWTVWIKEETSNKIVSKKQTGKIKTKSGEYLIDLGLK